VLAVTDEVLQLARQRLVHEPVRTLDAIHLASCRVFHRTLGTVSVLSLDDRIRANAQALGMGVVPS
jgi:hypothetical protein